LALVLLDDETGSTYPDEKQGFVATGMKEKAR
jgi:hypothetical protein